MVRSAAELRVSPAFALLRFGAPNLPAVARTRAEAGTMAGGSMSPVFEASSIF
jgi:hypothetical protein